MTGNSRKTVCMIVYSDLAHDSRVKKEAISLAENDYCINVFYLAGDRPFNMNRNGIALYPVRPPSFYKRLIRLIVGKKNTAVSMGISPHKKGLVSAFKGFIYVLHDTVCYLDFYLKVFRSKNRKADIYHAHDLNMLPLAAKLAKKYKAKLIYDSHEYYLERNKIYPYPGLIKSFLLKLEKFLCNKADLVITVSQSIADDLAQRYNLTNTEIILNTPRKNITTANPDDLRKKLNITSKYIISYAGGITFNRGLEQSIEAMSHMKNFSLVIFGFGKEEYINQLKKINEKFSVSDKVFFHPSVDPEKLINYLQQTDIGIAPIQNTCLSYYYCLPNKIFEYIQAHIPIAVSNFPEMEQIVCQNNIGISFDPSNPKEIAENIDQFMKEYSKQKSGSNFQVLARKYCWENEVDKLLKLYLDLC